MTDLSDRVADQVVLARGTKDRYEGRPTTVRTAAGRGPTRTGDSEVRAGPFRTPRPREAPVLPILAPSA